MVDDQPDHAGRDHQLSHPQHAGVAAPTLLADLHISAQEYSWIVGAFQGAIMLQPICGYVMDVIGLKLGFAIFAVAWSFISMAHGLAGSWQALVWLRGLLGFAEGSANPAGMKATSEWFPAQGARIRRRRLQHRRVVRLDARAAAGGLGDSVLQLAGRVRADRRARPGLGGAVAVALSVAGETSGAVGRGAAITSSSGQEQHLQSDGTRPSIAEHPRAAQFLGHRAAAVSGRSDVGHTHVLVAALPDHGAALRSEADRARSRGCRFSPPTGCIFGGPIELDAAENAASASSTRGAAPSRWARA